MLINTHTFLHIELKEIITEVREDHLKMCSVLSSYGNGN